MSPRRPPSRRPSPIGALLAAVLVAGTAPLHAQGATPSAAGREASLRARWQRGPRPSPHTAHRLDEALRPYGLRWDSLDGSRRRELREAFEAVLPDARFATYDLNHTQARAIVFVALGAPDARDDAGEENGGERLRCARTARRVSDAAVWIDSAVAPLRRDSREIISRDRETALVDGIVEHAREAAIAASGSDCVEARDAAQALLDAARDVQHRFRESVVHAWMAVGDDRLAKLQELAAAAERAALGCGGE